MNASKTSETDVQFGRHNKTEVRIHAFKRLKETISIVNV